MTTSGSPASDCRPSATPTPASFMRNSGGCSRLETASPREETMAAISFIHDLGFGDLPTEVARQAKRCVLDLIGVAAGGVGTDLSRISRRRSEENTSELK